MYIELDDFRQIYTVSVNEIRKFIRGKRLFAYLIVVALVFALLTILPYTVGSNISDFYNEFNIMLPMGILSAYLSFMDTLIIIGATLFASSVIVSEFEDRTALVLFTRPIKKTSIFIGKTIGCLLLQTAVVVLFYLGVAFILLLTDGSVPMVFFTSMGISFMYIVATTGVALILSSLLKRSGITAVLTFFMLIMIIPIISVVFLISGSDPWFILNWSALSIIPPFVGGVYLPIENVARACWVLAVWGLVPAVAAWLAFIKREF